MELQGLAVPEQSFADSDMFGMATSPTKLTSGRPEHAALVNVLRALRAHPAVDITDWRSSVEHLSKKLAIDVYPIE